MVLVLEEVKAALFPQYWVPSLAASLLKMRCLGLPALVSPGSPAQGLSTPTPVSLRRRVVILHVPCPYSSACMSLFLSPHFWLSSVRLFLYSLAFLHYSLYPLLSFLFYVTIFFASQPCVYFLLHSSFYCLRNVIFPVHIRRSSTLFFI